MRPKTYSLNMVWSPLPVELASVPILKKLEAWDGTKYRSGQKCRGVDADCIGFGCGAIDDIDGRPRAQSSKLPADSALHNPKAAVEAIKAIREIYSPAERVHPFDGQLFAQPMDILVVATGAGGPGHMMLVGPEVNTLWHCIQGAGVTKSGWSLFSGFEKVFALYRLGDRDGWQR